MAFAMQCVNYWIFRFYFIKEKAKDMKNKVLIVEDNSGFSRVLKDEIEHSGYEAIAVDNGVDALLRFLEGDIELILMDVVMPKLSGIDALRIIRKIDPAARVIIITGNPTDEMRKEAMKLGAVDFLTKPFSLKSLIEVIKAA
jgi:DNA-binding response OmpR family regulator